MQQDIAATLRPTGGRTILVVDDEHDVRSAMCEFLRDNIPDACVLEAASGMDGLSVMAGQHVDLIITDFNMPGMNGSQFVREAERSAPQTRHIIVTAFLAEALRENGSLPPGERMLQKPFGAEALLQDVEEALRESKAPAAKA